jgi:hypothetical protein
MFDAPETCNRAELVGLPDGTELVQISLLACRAFLLMAFLQRWTFAVRSIGLVILCPHLRIQQWGCACCLVQAVGPSLSGYIADVAAWPCCEQLGSQG